MFIINRFCSQSLDGGLSNPLIKTDLEQMPLPLLGLGKINSNLFWFLFHFFFSYNLIFFIFYFLFLLCLTCFYWVVIWVVICFTCFYWVVISVVIFGMVALISLKKVRMQRFLIQGPLQDTCFWAVFGDPLSGIGPCVCVFVHFLSIVIWCCVCFVFEFLFNFCVTVSIIRIPSRLWIQSIHF